MTGRTTPRTSTDRPVGSLGRGVYLHYATGRLIVRTRALAGSRGGELLRWEIGHADDGGQVTVDGDQGPWKTLAAAIEGIR